MKPFLTLLRIELRLSLRNLNMTIFAVLLPLAVLTVLGLLSGSLPAADGAAYTVLERSFGALCCISICAGGLMGLPLVVSDYRERKILKRFQVTPVSPAKLLFAELAVYALYCAASMLTLFPAAVFFGGLRFPGSLPRFLGSWLLTMVSTLSVGLLVGGLAKNAKTASTIACCLYFPMLIFSGATLPLERMPLPLQKIVCVFPLAQGIRLMQAAFLGIPLDRPWLPVSVMGAVTLVCSGVSVACFKWE